MDQYGTISMHDLVQQMGMEIVQQESPNIPRKRSRLCNHEDALKVLTGNKVKSFSSIFFFLSQGSQIKKFISIIF